MEVLLTYAIILIISLGAGHGILSMYLFGHRGVWAEFVNNYPLMKTTKNMGEHAKVGVSDNSKHIFFYFNVEFTGTHLNVLPRFLNSFLVPGISVPLDKITAVDIRRIGFFKYILLTISGCSGQLILPQAYLKIVK
jgi:hypothetical protein